MVAIDNKIEQAMVSGIPASFPSLDLAAAYVTRGRTEGVGAKAVCQEPEEGNSLLPLALEALGSPRQRATFLGHLQSALVDCLLSSSWCLLQAPARPRQAAGQGAETLAFCLQPAFGVGQSSLDASALQCLCRGGLGSGVRRKQEAKHPTPSPSPHQVEVRLHRAAYRAAGAWGIQPLVTASPGTQLPASGAVLRSRADVPVLAPSLGASILLHQTALQVPPQLCVLGHPEEAVRLSWGEVHKWTDDAVARRSSLRGVLVTGP